MLKKLIREEKGMTAVMAAVIMLVMIALAGLVLDGGILIYQRARLEAATESAAVATSAAYNEDLWNNYRIVELDEYRAIGLASTYLQQNMPQARMVMCKVDPSSKDTAEVATKIDVELVFMKAFGIDKTTITTKVKSHVK